MENYDILIYHHSFELHKSLYQKQGERILVIEILGLIDRLKIIYLNFIIILYLKIIEIGRAFYGYYQTEIFTRLAMIYKLP